MARDPYDRDFFEWTRCNAALLRAGRFGQADIEHIAEEIEDMGNRDQRELANRLQVLLMNLLKWNAQPGRRTSSWQETIDTERDRLQRILKQMPSLCNLLAEDLEATYPKAVRGAMRETGLPRKMFPESCPFTIEQMLDEEFFPE